MTRLFDRSCRVVVAFPVESDFQTVSAESVEIKDLRVTFKYDKALTSDPNSARIVIYNLAQESRQALPGSGAKVLLQLGYGGNLETAFIGDARLIEHRREGVEWHTVIECGDGARSYKFARVNEGFAANTPAFDVINTIGAATGLDVSALTGIKPDLAGQKFNQGYSAKGGAVKELTKVLEALGYEVSIQNNALQVTRSGGVTTEPVLVLGPDSGLIGSPETGSVGKDSKRKPFLKVKSLLLPQMIPGRRVRLDSAEYKGDFRAVSVEGEGDTAGGTWYNTTELQAL